MDRDWLRFYDEGVPRTYDYPHLTLSQMLAQVAAEHPNAPATLFHGKQLTYGDLQRQVEWFAAGLTEEGFQAGDRIAVMLPNLPQFPIAFYGALRAGMIVVPTNPLYKPRELAHQLQDSGAVAIVTLPQLLETVLAAVPKTPVRLFIMAHVADALPIHLAPLYRLKNSVPKLAAPARVTIKSWRAMLTRSATPPADVAPDSLAVLQYTGGTTGTSKGAMLSHRNLLANAIQVYEWQAKVAEPFRTLCATPFFHVYGLTVGMNMTIWGHGLMILTPRFEAEPARALIRKLRPTLFPGVPTMYIALNSLPTLQPGDLDSLEVCISGAAPLPAAVQTKFQTLAPKVRLVEGYGLTEAAPVTHCNPVNGSRPGSVGVPFPDTDAAVISPDSWERVPNGEIGEIAATGPQIMLGYWQRPEETDRVIKDGWLRTGDLGYRDDDGFFHIVDRIKDLIIAGGYNVYPREIEEVLFHHPDILEASVVGVQSEYRGETVKAFVVLKPGVEPDTESILTLCREELAAFKVPKIVEFVDQLPKSLIGKVLRRELRESDRGNEVATLTSDEFTGPEPVTSESRE